MQSIKLAHFATGRPAMPRFIGVVVVLAVILTACGYRFSGSGELPAGVQTIFVPVFENRTGEVGLEDTLTNGVINEFVLKRKDALMEKDSAESILQGTILSIRDETISRSSGNTALERRVTVTVALALKDRNNQTLWVARQVAANEAYDVDQDKQATEENRRSALDVAFRRLSENIYNRLMEDF